MEAGDGLLELRGATCHVAVHADASTEACANDDDELRANVTDTT